MLMSLFSVVLPSLVAAGSVPRANRPFNGDETIICDHNNVTGTLVLDTLLSGSPLPPMPLGLNDNILQANSTEQQFVFQNCTSGFMGYTPSIQNGIAVLYG
jgi:hypothetical protein